MFLVETGDYMDGALRNFKEIHRCERRRRSGRALVTPERGSNEG